MKIKAILLAAFSIIGITGIFAQGIEYDDMYFNAEDREKLKSQRTAKVVYNTPAKAKQFDYYDETENINPTDSYSARNINPEYTSRAQTRSAQVDEGDYFVNNYQYNRNELTNWNNNFNRWNNNSWYRPNFYGPGINTWNSPFYGYNSWNSPWYDPFWASNGWSTSFAFHYGSNWNYGWGGRYNYWNRPYFGWDPYGMGFGSGMGMGMGRGMGMWPGMGMSSGMGMGYGFGYGGGYWNNYRYPGSVVVINNGERNGRGVVYGKRPTRGTSIVSDRNNVRTRSSINNNVRGDNTNSGRIATQNSRRQAEYYNRSRSNANAAQSSRSNTQYNRSRSWDNNNSNNGYNNNRSYNTNSRSSTPSPSYSPSRSSGTGAGTRTSSGSSGGRRGRD